MLIKLDHESGDQLQSHFNALNNESISFIEAYNTTIKIHDNDYQFDHTMIKTGDNQWNIIDNKSSKKCIQSSSRKIIFTPPKEPEIYSTQDAVKILTLSHDKDIAIEQIEQEKQFFQQNNILINKPIVQGNCAYIFIENCGMPLHQWLLERKTLNLEDCFNAALDIVNNLVIHKEIYGSISSENIYRRAIAENGTLSYEYLILHADSPHQNQTLNQESQIVALTDIFLKLFSPALQKGCSSSINLSSDDLIQSIKTISYLYWNNYKIEIADDIDQQLREDLIILLKEMIDVNPKKRPSLEFIHAFFNGISYRCEHDKRRLAYNNNANQINTFLKLMGIDYFIPYLEIPSHKIVTKDVIKNKRDFKTIYTDIAIDDLNDIKTEKKDLIALFDSSEALLSLFKSEKFRGTNSDGIKKIQAIVSDPSKTIANKILEISAIGKHKTERSLSNWIKRHSFFGKGRHENIEKLYQALAKIDFNTNTDLSDLIHHDLPKIISDISPFFTKDLSFVFKDNKSKSEEDEFNQGKHYKF